MELINLPSNLPDAIIDPLSGLAINHPVVIQNYPGWWDEQPGLYQHILEERKKLGIVVDDGISEWEAQVREMNSGQE